MKLRRFRVAKEFIHGREASIGDRSEIKHILKVLRLRVGNQVVLFDGEGKEYQATITNLSPHKASFSLFHESPMRSMESPLVMILGLGLLKSSKFDWLIQKATELGVSEIVPFSSLRAVPRLEENKPRSRQSRWEKIASEAARQCGRAKVPKVHLLRTFEEMLAMDFEKTIKIFLWEKENQGNLRQALVAPTPRILALVGPEGGFSEEEASRARGAGFRPVRLGPRILRAETAGIVIVGLLQFLLGDLHGEENFPCHLLPAIL